MDVRTFVDRAHEVHGDRYDYSRVEYVNNRTPVCIVCKTHGEFQQTPYKHLSGQGCPKCAKNFKDSTVSFIEKARGIHGDFYDYSKVEYVDQRTLVCIIDPVYGEFWQSPNAHLNGEGCPKRRSEKAQKTRAEFPLSMVDIGLTHYPMPMLLLWLIFRGGRKKVLGICQS